MSNWNKRVGQYIYVRSVCWAATLYFIACAWLDARIAMYIFLYTLLLFVVYLYEPNSKYAIRILRLAGLSFFLSLIMMTLEIFPM